MDSIDGPSPSLISLAEEAISEGADLYGSGKLLRQVLAENRLNGVLDPLGTGRPLSPAFLFDALNGHAHSALQSQVEQLFEIVGLPGEPLRKNLQPDDLLLRRALGESGLGHIAVIVSGELIESEALADSGLVPETRLPGAYVHVVETGVVPHGIDHEFARQLLDGQGRLRRDQVVMRLRPSPDFGVFKTNINGETLLENTIISCGPNNQLQLHPKVVRGITQTQSLAGENFTLATPPCAATNLCPTKYQATHASGDATHLVALTEQSIRVAELAGLFGINLALVSGSDRLRRKANTAVKDLPLLQPFSDLTFIAIRQGESREVHIDRGDFPWVEAYVEGNLWRCLAFEAHEGLVYTLFKRRYFEASLHRQWGRDETIKWIIGLANFYQDLTGLRLGIGDISHVVGEDITDHGSHELGVDVDVYVLAYPPNSTLPDAFWCSGPSGRITLDRLVAPADASGTYANTHMPGLPQARQDQLFDHYATIVAYCIATWDRVHRVVWHGVQVVEDDALQIAREAFDSGWRDSWGAGPSRREDIAPGTVWRRRRRKLIGQGSANYNRAGGWPLHRDHIHIRLVV